MTTTKNPNKNRRCFLRDEKDGTLYCQDGKFRKTVTFGTERSCLKFWKGAGYAKRAARKLDLDRYTIFFVYEGQVVDAYGNVADKNKIGSAQAARQHLFNWARHENLNISGVIDRCIGQAQETCNESWIMTMEFINGDETTFDVTPQGNIEHIGNE